MSRRNYFRKLQKQGYEKRKYRNPYFEDKKKTKRSIKTILIIVLVAIVLTFLLNFLLRSPIYEIKQVMVKGTETIKPEEITDIADNYLEQPRFIFSNQRNRFLFNQKGLIEQLSEKYSFEKLELKIFQNSLNILVKEKTSQLLWVSDENTYLVDLSGSIIRELTEEELVILNEPLPLPLPEEEIPESTLYIHPLKTLPKFRDLNKIEAKTGQQVLTEKEIINIFLFHELLHNQQISFVETKIDRLAGKWMSVLTQKGYDILFDATGNIQQQAKNLEIIIRESVGEEDDIEYIDLRFGDHVYYK